MLLPSAYPSVINTIFIPCFILAGYFSNNFKSEKGESPPLTPSIKIKYIDHRLNKYHAVKMKF
jgi:hypothetical protein